MNKQPLRTLTKPVGLCVIQKKCFSCFMGCGGRGDSELGIHPCGKFRTWTSWWWVLHTNWIQFMDCSLKPFTQLFTYLFPSLGCEKILFPMTIVSPMVWSLCPSWLQAFMAATISDSECRQHLFQWKGDWQKCISGIFNFFITFFSRGVCFLSENSWSRDNKRRLPQGLLLSGMDQLTFLLKGLIL